jgi:hypothetical protein
VKLSAVCVMQGTGPEVGKVDEALQVASSFAGMKL